MKIRIIKTPFGEAPEEVRQKWVGLELPCDKLGDEGHFTFEVRSLKTPSDPRQNVWFVPQVEAITILECRFPEAAQWFKEAGYPIPLMHFTFGYDEAELIGSIN